jgi:drug/metabolite transporter (DMT)-like permease
MCAILCATIEMLLLGKAMTFMSVFVFLPLFYFFSTIIYSFVINPFTEKNIETINKHKKNISIYVISGALGNFFWFYGAFLIGVSSAVVIAVLYRFFIMFYGTFYLKEKMSISQIFISSIVILCSFTFASDADKTEKIGFLLSAISYGFYALADINQKKLSTEINWKLGLILRQSFQFILFSIVSIIYMGSITELLLKINYEILIWTGIIAFIGGFLSKSFHFVAVKKMDLSRIVVVEQSKPILVLFGGYFLLQESITEIQFYASLVILILTILFFSKEKKVI